MYCAFDVFWGQGQHCRHWFSEQNACLLHGVVLASRKHFCRKSEGRLKAFIETIIKLLFPSYVYIQQLYAAVWNHFFSWLASVVATVLSADKHTITQPRLAKKKEKKPENCHICFSWAASICLHSFAGLQRLMKDGCSVMPHFFRLLFDQPRRSRTGEGRCRSRTSCLDKSVASSSAPRNVMWLSARVTAENIAL